MSETGPKWVDLFGIDPDYCEDMVDPDEAVAAVRRVRAIHQRRQFTIGRDLVTFGMNTAIQPDRCTLCPEEWPCQTIRALDGPPDAHKADLTASECGNGCGVLHERPSGPDMRLPGERFCADCPDREACATSYPCDFVRRVNAAETEEPK